MSGLEVIGGIASIVQLATTVYTISKTLYEVGEALSNAPSDIKDLARDLETFSEELHLYSSLLNEKNGRYGDRIYRLTAKIIGDCATICAKIDRILRKLRSRTVWARVKWLYKEKEILKLLARLRHLKLSLMGTLNVLSALKADYVMDMLGGQNSSLIESAKDETLSLETLNEVEETRQKLAGISIALGSHSSIYGSSVIHKGSLETQYSDDKPDPSKDVPEQVSQDSYSGAQVDANIPPIQSSQLDLPQPYLGMIVLNPAALESVQSFHTAVSFQDETEETLTNRRLPEFQSLQSEETFNMPNLPNNSETEKRWREELVRTATKHLNMSQSAAETWAMDLQRPTNIPAYAVSTPSRDRIRKSLTPEEIEFKRQRDISQRDTRIQVFGDRSASSPNIILQDTPDTISRRSGLTPPPLLPQGSQGSQDLSDISRPAYLSGYTSNHFPTPKVSPREGSPIRTSAHFSSRESKFPVSSFEFDDLYAEVPSNALEFSGPRAAPSNYSVALGASATSSAMGSPHLIHSHVTPAPEYTPRGLRLTPGIIIFDDYRRTSSCSWVPSPNMMVSRHEQMISSAAELICQQQQGVMAQEAGQMVAPASSQPSATLQPGGIPGQQTNMNDQRAIANPNVRAQQQLQMFNVQQAQQAQQQRMQYVAQLQSQAAARSNTQAKARRMPLQGQPGGMGSGPIPPQQSPDMATLNAPLRTSYQQMNHPEPAQIDAGGQFGQPLDPRFMQGNQWPVSPVNPVNGFNPAMIASMPQKQQQRLAELPPEKVTEVVNRWNEQRAQHMNVAKAQAGRPPIPMQGNSQFRPGQQVPQPNQFNPQNTLNQFMITNPGQRPPPSLVAYMTARQLIMSQRQMAQNPNQQRNPPPMMTPNEQRAMMQIDGMDFPPALLNHAHMPRGIPGEVKKWGALKQWAHQNPTIGPEAFENIKGLQKLLYHQMVRARNQQAGQSQTVGIPTGGQGGPGTAAMVPPRMSAPVAPMGQNPMQLQNGVNMGQQILPPSKQDIQKARNHPSGKMVNASDDQIRAFLIRNQMTQQQQRQNMIQQQQQMQMANQISQMNGQQPRPAMPGQAGTLMGATQNLLGQISQTKQPRPAPEPALPTPTTANASRSNRPAPNGRSSPQASSPAPTSKNLKRASSDDVIEVPNPNTQPQRSVSQQNQAPKPAPQQARPNLTPQQIAQLDPEARKKYDAAVRMFQASRGEQLNMAKLKTIMEEENVRAREPLPEIPQDQETRLKVASLLRNIPSSLNNMMKVIPKWYAMTRDDNRARDYFHTVRSFPLKYPTLMLTKIAASNSEAIQRSGDEGA
jgi:hypothetical protein